MLESRQVGTGILEYCIISFIQHFILPTFQIFNILPRAAFFFPAQKHLKIFAVQEVSGIA